MHGSTRFLSVLALVLAAVAGCGAIRQRIDETDAKTAAQLERLVQLEEDVVSLRQTLERVNFIRVIQQAKEKVYPVIAYVKVIRETYERGLKQKQQVSGSGVIISPDGYVVTNYHVAEKATEIKCVLFDEKEVRVTLVGTDQDTDVALLKLELPREELPVPYASFGDSSLVREGDFVMTMGCPLGLTRSVSFGIISNPKQYLGDEWCKYNIWFQTDAAINPGNSGGPLVDVNGQVIGINTLKFRGADNVGFAIPANIVKEAVEKIERTKIVKRAWAGIQFQALKDFERSTFFDAQTGVLVASIDPASPAEAAGLKPGDLIVKVGSQEVKGMFVEDLPEVRRRFAALPQDEDVQLEIRRNNSPLTIPLRLGAKGRVEGEEYECAEWHMTVKEINKFADPVLYYFKKQGCYIRGAEWRGNAARSGLSGGEIILKIGEKEVGSIADVKAVYEELDKLPKGSRKVVFEVLRGSVAEWAVLNFNKKKAEYEEEE
jgi:serine protease Do